jgi:hypothetical protein
MERMMLEETKKILAELVIELHDQARHIVDQGRSLEIRKAADEISDIIKKEKNVTF